MASLTQLLSDWLLWLLGGVAALLSPALGVVKRNRDRTLQNKRQLQGDPDDPNADGVLQIANDTRARVDEVDRKLDDFRRETKREHERVMARLERLADDADGDFYRGGDADDD